MLHAATFGPRLTWLTTGLGTVGIISAAIEVVDPGLEFSAVSALAIVVFHLSTGWRTLPLGNETSTVLTNKEPTPSTRQLGATRNWTSARSWTTATPPNSAPATDS